MRNTFYENILENVRSRFDLEKYDINLYHAEKSNGLIYTGVYIKEAENAVSPVIYLDDYYNKWHRNEYSTEYVVNEVIRIYNDIKMNPFVMTDAYNTKEFIIANVFIHLVNTYANINILKRAPSREMFNLSMVYKCAVMNNEQGMAAFLITNAILEEVGVTEEELYEAAMQNTKRIFPIVCNTMYDMIGSEIEDVDDLIKNSPMYVMTNEQKNGGAHALIYPEYFEELSSMIEDNLIIIPSSIHELIILPASLANIEEANIMLNTINPQIDAEDYLGNRVFYYDRENKELKIT